ncbi:MAG TPA: hypothetical protein VK120_09305 [Sporosarcina sp.]|nr:hypothetical protein [Sporosarcina sp.]
MREVQWQVQEQFVFQPTLQKPISMKQLQVTPQFSEEMIEGHPKISGIYHVSMTCALSDEQMNAIELEDEQIVIDTIDLQGRDGYFEYAVPFHIEFPPEAAKAATVQVSDAHAVIEENGCITVIWDVQCMYEVEGIQREQQQVEKKQQETKKATVANNHVIQKAAQQEKQEVKNEQKSVKKQPVEPQVAKEENEQPEQRHQSSNDQEDAHEEKAVAQDEEDLSKVIPDDHVLSFFQQLADGTSKKSFIAR